MAPLQNVGMVARVRAGPGYTRQGTIVDWNPVDKMYTIALDMGCTVHSWPRDVHLTNIQDLDPPTETSRRTAFTEARRIIEEEEVEEDEEEEVEEEEHPAPNLFGVVPMDDEDEEDDRFTGEKLRFAQEHLFEMQGQLPDQAYVTLMDLLGDKYEGA